MRRNALSEYLSIPSKTIKHGRGEDRRISKKGLRRPSDPSSCGKASWFKMSSVNQTTRSYFAARILASADFPLPDSPMSRQLPSSLRPASIRFISSAQRAGKPLIWVRISSVASRVKRPEFPNPIGSLGDRVGGIYLQRSQHLGEICDPPADRFSAAIPISASQRLAASFGSPEWRSRWQSKIAFIRSRDVLDS